MFSGTGTTKQSEVLELSPSQFEEKIKNDDNGVLLDVRTNFEFNEERIPGAKLIDMSAPTFRSEVEKLDKNKNYYLYCRSGNRSYFAGRAMLQMGFNYVAHLETGIIGWNGEIER